MLLAITQQAIDAGAADAAPIASRAASPLVALALIGAAGIGAQWAAWKLKLPSILLLLLAGILVGPLLGWLQPHDLFGAVLYPLVSLAVAVILYEGGLSLHLHELGAHGTPILRLLTVGVVTTWTLATIAALTIAKLPWETAMVLGAILTVTGPTVIGPLLRQIRPRGPAEAIAKWEGIVVDVVGATLAVLVLHVATEGFAQDGAIHSATGALVDLFKTAIVGTAFGVLGTYALAIPLRKHLIPDELENAVSLAIVLGIFVAADSLAHESGLLAVTLMGFLLANRKDVSVHHIIEFKENLRVLLISTLFIVLAATIDLGALRATGWNGLLFVVALIVVVRPASVFLSTLGTTLTSADRTFLAFLAPRGIVAAAVSSLFALRMQEANVPGADLMAPLAFLVIVVTVAVYGLGAGPLARRLKLSDPDAQGTLIAGAGPFALEFGRALKKLGIDVVHVDTNRASIAEARLGGLPAYYGSILSSEVVGSLPLGGTGRFVGLTPNDEVNALAAAHFSTLYERANVYQSASGARSADDARKDLRGRTLFHGDWPLSRLDGAIRAGSVVKTTNLTEEFGFAKFLEKYGENTLPLGIVRNGRLELFTADKPPAPEPEAALLSLVREKKEEEQVQIRQAAATSSAAAVLP
ncbi:K(+)/H(+) antiporter NhaP [Planctomycetes bacterium Poly30]|uniref:K(+)/H(+) antiporter NhaP n=1 Tax=Saltatorellus ferox TaxID=2528018 RepID=A0A518ETJ9_9BACT|nr:K(+)/H(+) antiporter NhaP [Planctomycetes bacterium Poly30]